MSLFPKEAIQTPNQMPFHKVKSTQNRSTILTETPKANLSKDYPQQRKERKSRQHHFQANLITEIKGRK